MRNGHFIRGGQVTLHYLRMLTQVWSSLAKMAIVISITIFALTLSLQLKSYHVKNIPSFAISALYSPLGINNKIITFISKWDKEYKMSVGSFIENPSVKKVREEIITGIISSLLYAWATIPILGIFSCFYFYKQGTRMSDTKTLRGMNIVPAATLTNLIKKYNKKQKRQSFEKSQTSYSIGSIPYPVRTEQLHTMICGSTGTGKTVLISDLITQIKKNGDQAFIFDKMGTFTERFYEEGKDSILNPFDTRSKNWQMFSEIAQEGHFNSIAQTLIPESTNGEDPFWINAARTLFSEVCAKVWKQGEDLTNSEIVELLLKKELKEASELAKDTAAQALIDAESPKTALSVMAVLSTYLKSFNTLRNEGEKFSIREWLHKGKGECIFVTSKGDQHASLRPLISTWFEILLFNLLSLKKNSNRSIWIILDELPSLHKLSSLEQGLSESRQFGGCFVIGLQSMPQLRKRYGRDCADGISAVCRNKLLLMTPDKETAQWASNQLGGAEVQEMKESLSYGAHSVRDGVSSNNQTTIRPLVLPSELMKMKNLECYTIMTGGFPIAHVKFQYKEYPKNNDSIIPFNNDEAHKTSDTQLPDTKEVIKMKKEQQENKESTKKSEDSSFDFCDNDNSDFDF